MAIPQEIQDVIRLAGIQNTEENKLEQYKTEKATHQAAITELNSKIIDQNAVVLSARAALKVAANKI